MLVDASDGRLLPRIDDVLRHVDGDDRFRAELRASQVELVTRPSLSPVDVGRELAAARVDLAELVDDDMSLLACGSHPTARAPGPITDGERYAAIARDNPWAARHMLTCGLHIHVAVADGDRALAIYNALRSYLPEFAALAANSPYEEGSHSGVASTRLHLNRSLARHGVPPAFASWDAYAEFTQWGRAGGSIPDASYHWWDLRLHPGLGTLEVRICDTQTEIADTVALVALGQALVAWLASRYDAGEPLPVHDGHRISESVCSGTRSGSSEELLIDLETGERRSTIDRIAELRETLDPIARELGIESELARLPALAGKRGAARQEELVREDGVGRLVGRLARRTLHSARAFRRETVAPLARPQLESTYGVEPTDFPWEARVCGCGPRHGLVDATIGGDV